MGLFRVSRNIMVQETGEYPLNFSTFFKFTQPETNLPGEPDGYNLGLSGRIAEASGEPLNLKAGPENGTSDNEYAGVEWGLPFEYIDGAAVTVRVTAKAINTAHVANLVDISLWKNDLNEGFGADLCETEPRPITTSPADYDFTITPASLEAGDRVGIKLTVSIDDTGGTNGVYTRIYDVRMIIGIKG